MSDAQLECVVAAILTNASIDSTGSTSQNTVTRYAQVLQMLRAAGGPISPNPDSKKR